MKFELDGGRGRGYLVLADGKRVVAFGTDPTPFRVFEQESGLLGFFRD